MNKIKTDINSKSQKVTKFFFPFLFDDWQGLSYEIQKGKILWGQKMNDQILKAQEKAFKSGQDLRKIVDKDHKWKIGDNKKK
jgi:hypothetical protein